MPGLESDPTMNLERRRQSFDTAEEFYQHGVGRIEQLTTNIEADPALAEKLRLLLEDDPPEPDTVNHPPHYCNRDMEAIDIIEMIIEIEPNPKVAYNMSNVLKYLLRFRDKGKAIHDLSKSVWYLNRMIDKIKEEESK